MGAGGIAIKILMYFKSEIVQWVLNCCKESGGISGCIPLHTTVPEGVGNEDLLCGAGAADGKYRSFGAACPLLSGLFMGLVHESKQHVRGARIMLGHSAPEVSERAVWAVDRAYIGAPCVTEIVRFEDDLQPFAACVAYDRVDSGQFSRVQ